MRLPILVGVILATVVCPLLSMPEARADPRPFTFVYDTYPEGKGNVEYEQWATFENGKPNDHGSNALRLRHEFEFGLADYFDLSVYVANWRYEDSKDFTGSRYENSGIEGILYLSNPATDSLGAGLYGEVEIGQDSADFEFKILLQKDLGRWTFAYNLILETEVQGLFSARDANEATGEFSHAVGVSYSLTPQLRLGGELLVESVFAEWSHYDGTQAFLGPNISYVFNQHAWLAFAPLFQLTNRDDEPKIQARLLFGYDF